MPNTARTAASPQWNVINGTEQPEFLFGTPGPDLISGFGGEDLMLGEGGGDILQGGEDRDILSGGLGNDRILGGGGNDLGNGHGGNDRISGVAGADFLAGGVGWDGINGGAGDDALWGGPGGDWLEGNAGRDDVQGGTGRDRLSGGDGNDTLRGGMGDDILSGGAKDDLIFGQRGNDRINERSAEKIFANVATDGETLVVAAPSGQMLIYDVETQKALGDIQASTYFSWTSSVAVSEGRVLVGEPYLSSAVSTGVSLYDTNGDFLRKLENPEPGGSRGFGSVIDLDGDRAVVATNGKVYFYDADTGAIQNTYTLPPSDGDAGWIVSKAELSGDTAAVHISFVGGGKPEYTLVIDAATGELRHQIAPAGYDLDESGTRDIAFDGDTLIITEPTERLPSYLMSQFEYVHQYQADSGAFVRTLDFGQLPTGLAPVISRFVGDVEVDDREILVEEELELKPTEDIVTPDKVLIDAKTGATIQRIVNPDADPETNEGHSDFSNGVLAWVTQSDPSGGSGQMGSVALFWRDSQEDGGNDSLDGGIGDDVLDGGFGNDEAVFSGDRAGYRISTDDGLITVSDIDGKDGWTGTDTVRHIENLRFADQTIPVGAGIADYTDGILGKTDDWLLV
jgi:hypothetical protein